MRVKRPISLQNTSIAYTIPVCYFLSYFQRCFILPPHNKYKLSHNQMEMEYKVYSIFPASIELVAGDICYFLLLLLLSNQHAVLEWAGFLSRTIKDLLSMQYLNRVKAGSFLKVQHCEGLNAFCWQPLPSWRDAPRGSLSAPHSTGWGWGSGPGAPRAPRQTLVQTRQSRSWWDLWGTIRDHQGKDNMSNLGARQTRLKNSLMMS